MLIKLLILISLCLSGNFYASSFQGNVNPDLEAPKDEETAVYADVFSQGQVSSESLSWIKVVDNFIGRNKWKFITSFASMPKYRIVPADADANTCTINSYTVRATAPSQKPSLFLGGTPARFHAMAGPQG